MMKTDPMFRDGTVAIWKTDRGFGFIQPEEGGPRIFVNIRDFPKYAARPEVGAAVRFATVIDESGKPRAVGVTTPGARVSAVRVARATFRPGDILGWLSVALFAALLATLVMASGLSLWVPVGYVVLSVICFIAYAGDKNAALSGSWRTSESRLLITGLIGGWPGAVVAQRLLRHKTRKRSFISLFWVTVAVNVIALVVFGWPPLLERFLELFA